MSPALAEVLERINAALGLYIGVHERVIGGNLLVKLFRRIDFKSAVGELEILIDIISSCLDRLESLGFEPDELPIAEAAVDYCIVLRMAMEKLHHIVHRLAAKADGAPYAMGDYNSDCEEYEILVAKYVGRGNHLNILRRS